MSASSLPGGVSREAETVPATWAASGLGSSCQLRAGLVRPGEEDAAEISSHHLALEDLGHPLDIGPHAVVRLALVARRGGSTRPRAADVLTRQVLQGDDLAEDRRISARFALVHDDHDRGRVMLQHRLEGREQRRAELDASLHALREAEQRAQPARLVGEGHDPRASRRANKLQMRAQPHQLRVEKPALSFVQLVAVRTGNMVQKQVVVTRVKTLGAHRQIEAQRPLVGRSQLRLQFEQRVEALHVKLPSHPETP